MKKKLLSLALLVILFSLMALGSTAYFTYEGRATNVITTGAVLMDLKEVQIKDGVETPYPGPITNVMPGRSVSKIPYVEAEEGTQPFYTRVKVDTAVTRSDGTAASADDVARYFLLNYDTEHWAQGADGWWYYLGQLEAGQRAALFTQVTFAPELPNAYQSCQVVITVIAQATQVKNNPVPNGDYTAIVGWSEEAQ